MTVPTASFKWLDILEKEFDKAAIGISFLFREIGSTFDEAEICKEGQDKLGIIMSCFSQLTHKAQTIFQTNAKYEAELLHLREDLAQAIALKQSAEQQVSELLVQIHASQLQMHSKSGSSAVYSDAESILKRLTSDFGQRRIEASVDLNFKEKLKLYEEENENLRAYMTALHSELYGARLAAKYLDKELAGRIQQMHLLGRDVSPDLRDKLWHEIESEIQLQRQKVIVKACQSDGRQIKKRFFPQPSLVQNSETGSSKSDSLDQEVPAVLGEESSKEDALNVGQQGEDSPQATSLRRRSRMGAIREVIIHRQETEGLGMSITGGSEHGVPILISELYPDTPAGRAEALLVGDSIVSVNGIDMRKAHHSEAVQVLCSQPPGKTVLEVQYVNPGDELSDDEDILPETFKYGFFVDDEESQSNVTAPFSAAADTTPTAPRTRESSESESEDPKGEQA